MMLGASASDSDSGTPGVVRRVVPAALVGVRFEHRAHAVPELARQRGSADEALVAPPLHAVVDTIPRHPSPSRMITDVARPA